MDTLLRLSTSPCGDQDSEMRDYGELRRGELCPRCQKGIPDYDGMLDLVCPACQLRQSSAGFS